MPWQIGLYHVTDSLAERHNRGPRVGEMRFCHLKKTNPQNSYSTGLASERHELHLARRRSRGGICAKPQVETMRNIDPIKRVVDKGRAGYRDFLGGRGFPGARDL